MEDINFLVGLLYGKYDDLMKLPYFQNFVWEQTEQDDLYTTTILEDLSKGISFIFSGDTLVTISFRSEKYEDKFNQYKGILPQNLHFEMSVEEVHLLLSKPTQTGGDNNKGFMRRYINYWEKYMQGNWCIYIQYNKTKTKIEMINLQCEPLL